MVLVSHRASTMGITDIIPVMGTSEAISEKYARNVKKRSYFAHDSFIAGSLIAPKTPKEPPVRRVR